MIDTLLIHVNTCCLIVPSKHIEVGKTNMVILSIYKDASEHVHIFTSFHHGAAANSKKMNQPISQPKPLLNCINKTVYCCIVCAQRVVMTRRRLLEGKAGRTSRHQSPDTSGGLSIPVFDDSRGFMKKISKISHNPQAWPRDP